MESYSPVRALRCWITTARPCGEVGPRAVTGDRYSRAQEIGNGRAGRAYAHFKDKAALLAAIREAGFIEFVKAMEAAKKALQVLRRKWTP